MKSHDSFLSDNNSNDDPKEVPAKTPKAKPLKAAFILKNEVPKPKEPPVPILPEIKPPEPELEAAKEKDDDEDEKKPKTVKQSKFRRSNSLKELMGSVVDVKKDPEDTDPTLPSKEGTREALPASADDSTSEADETPDTISEADLPTLELEPTETSAPETDIDTIDPEEPDAPDTELEETDPADTEPDAPESPDSTVEDDAEEDAEEDDDPVTPPKPAPKPTPIRPPLPRTPATPPTPPITPPVTPPRPPFIPVAPVPPPPVVPPHILAPPVAPVRAPGSTHNTVIVRRRGGVAGPVLAFLAANYFDRKKHCQSMRAIKEVKKDLKDTQNATQTERQKTRATEVITRTTALEQQRRVDNIAQTTKSIQEQIKPSVEPAPEITINNQYEQKNTLEAPVSVASIIANKQFQTNQNTLKQENKTEVKAVAAPVIEQTVNLQNREVEPEKIEPEQIRHEVPAAVRETNVENVKETTFERHHEVKDDPAGTSNAATLGGGSGGAGGGFTGGAASPPSPVAIRPSESLPAVIPDKPSLEPNSDLYKQSVRNGILVGVCVVILGIIAYTVLT